MLPTGQWIFADIMVKLAGQSCPNHAHRIDISAHGQEESCSEEKGGEKEGGTQEEHQLRRIAVGFGQSAARQCRVFGIQARCAESDLSEVCVRQIRRTQSCSDRRRQAGLHRHGGVLHDAKCVLPAGNISLEPHSAACQAGRYRHQNRFGFDSGRKKQRVTERGVA